MTARFRPIVLLSDFGTKDAYVASVKGVIFSLLAEANVIDLTHEVEPQKIKQAAFLLEASYRYFPKGSIFVSVVEHGVGSERQILAAKTSHGIFLAPDNGLLTLVLKKEKSFQLRTVTNARFFLAKVSSTFHGRDCFAPTAARLAKNPSLFSRLGPAARGYRKLNLPEPRREGNKILGEVVYFDHFGNAFTNIPKDFLKGAGGKSKSLVRVGGKEIGGIRSSYFEAEKGRAVAVFSSTGILEIAVNQGSAREQLHLREGEAVEII